MKHMALTASYPASRVVVLRWQEISIWKAILRR